MFKVDSIYQQLTFILTVAKCVTWKLCMIDKRVNFYAHILLSLMLARIATCKVHSRCSPSINAFPWTLS